MPTRLKNEDRYPYRTPIRTALASPPERAKKNAGVRKVPKMSEPRRVLRTEMSTPPRKPKPTIPSKTRVLESPSLIQGSGFGRRLSTAYTEMAAAVRRDSWTLLLVSMEVRT